jgi:hypothetical protein
LCWGTMIFKEDSKEYIDQYIERRKGTPEGLWWNGD